jgi:EmrB/QacA subfamily drug resistance transporter
MISKSLSKRGAWTAAIIMIIAALMDLVDGTIVNVALPTLQNDLHASASTLEWVVSGYMLAFGAGLIIGGRLGDHFGRKRLFLFGTFGFGIASLLSGLAGTAEQLVVFRMLQGLTAALLVPQVLATFRSIFSGKERASAFGLYGAVAGLAAALGVILGGVLTQANIFGLGWRAIFLINVPIALIAGVMAISAVPETNEPEAGRLDLLGAGVLALSTVAITWPLLEGPGHDWPTWYFALMAAGVLAIGLLVKFEHRREKRGVQPLLQARQFAVPAFSAGVLTQMLFSIGLQGFSLVFILWLQLGHNFSPLHSGILLLAFSLGAILTAPVSGQWALSKGRMVLITGALLMAIATAAIAVLAWNNYFNPWAIAGLLVVSGAGLGLLVVPLVNVVLAAVPSRTAGGASGVFSTAQQLGGAIGIAIVGSIFFAKLAAGSYNDAFRLACIASVGAYLLCAVLCLFLPKKAVAPDAVEA